MKKEYLKPQTCCLGITNYNIMTVSITNVNGDTGIEIGDDEPIPSEGDVKNRDEWVEGLW